MSRDLSRTAEDSGHCGVANMLHLTLGSVAGKECAGIVLEEVQAVATQPLYRKGQCLAPAVMKAFLSWAHFYSERGEPLVLTDRDRKL